MRTVRKLKFFISLYLGVLVFLLLSVIAMPLIIQSELSLTKEIIIEEGLLETSLIVILLGISYFFLRAFKHTLKDHEVAVVRAGEEKSRLLSRLTEAFSYIGTINVELQEIRSILCGLESYPQTKREFNLFVDHLTAKAMTVAGTAWAVIRLISRFSGGTITEYTAVRPNGVLPSACMGNREVLEDRPTEGMRKIVTCQKNLDFLTVCILPMKPLSEEENILITAIISQIELFFLLYRAGFLNQKSFYDNTEKNSHDANC